MKTTTAKVVAGIAGIAILAGVASFGASSIGVDNKATITLAQANDEAQYNPKTEKKRKGGASK